MKPEVLIEPGPKSLHIHSLALYIILMQQKQLLGVKAEEFKIVTLMEVRMQVFSCKVLTESIGSKKTNKTNTISSDMAPQLDEIPNLFSTLSFFCHVPRYWTTNLLCCQTKLIL